MIKEGNWDRDEDVDVDKLWNEMIGCIKRVAKSTHISSSKIQSCTILHILP